MWQEKPPEAGSPCSCPLDLRTRIAPPKRPEDPALAPWEGKAGPSQVHSQGRASGAGAMTLSSGPIGPIPRQSKWPGGRDLPAPGLLAPALFFLRTGISPPSPVSPLSAVALSLLGLEWWHLPGCAHG